MSEHVESNRPVHTGTPDTTQTGPSCRVCCSGVTWATHCYLLAWNEAGVIDTDGWTGTTIAAHARCKVSSNCFWLR